MLVNAWRGFAVFEAELPLLGVLNRFNAFASVPPPACAAVAVPPAAPPEPLEGDEVELEEDDALLVEDEEEEDDEFPRPAALNVGLLEMAVVVARDAEGSVEFGPRRLPRNRGTTSAAYRSGAVVPLSLMVRSSGANRTRCVRIELRCTPGFLESEEAARTTHAVHTAAATKAAIAAQRRRERRASGSREPRSWECI
ncbi:MAG: hypothetical protein ACM336_00115 [Acidobacteriota bacterium]